MKVKDFIEAINKIEKETSKQISGISTNNIISVVGTEITHIEFHEQ